MIEIFSTRLITARKMNGLSMQELAGLAGISKQAISQYEKGEMMPTSESLIKLAKALHVDMDFFFHKPKSSEIKLAGKIHFREKEKLAFPELDQIKMKTVEFLEKYFELERIADNRDEFTNPIADLIISNNKEAQKAAKQVRKKWKLGDIPLKNILSILESKGIKIVEVEASDRFNGFAAWSGKIPVIVVNLKFEEVTRVRFTTLHELGHLVLTLVDGLDYKTIERICDAFASELLLPAEVLIFEMGNNRSRIAFDELKTVKVKYGISVQAILVSLAINNVINWDVYYNWKEQYNQLFANKEDFGVYIGEEEAVRFNQLLNKCLSEQKITIEKATSLTKYKPRSLDFISLEKREYFMS